MERTDITYSFENVIAWQKAHRFALLAYKATQEFPVAERYGLCSQFQRAATSVPANIAEGYKKLGKADKLRFFNIAQGSLEECRNYILFVRDLGYIDTSEFLELRKSLEEASMFLNSYCKGIINSSFASNENPV
ncbi:MAG: four helix bundle protein [Prevotella sp.]|nr:four helix bundle protein [Prevotella sp.]